MTKHESNLVSISTSPSSQERGQRSRKVACNQFSRHGQQNLILHLPQTTLQTLIKWLGVTGGFKLYLGCRPFPMALSTF